MRKLQRRVSGRFSGLEMLETRELLSAVVANTVDPLFLKADVAIWRPSTVTVMVSSNRNGVANMSWGYGIPTDQMVSGDLNGDGLTDTAAFRNGTWYIDLNRDGGVEETVSFGQAWDKAMIGDVDGDGPGGFDYLPERDVADGAESGQQDVWGGDDVALGGWGGEGGLPVVEICAGRIGWDRAVYRPEKHRAVVY